MLSPSIHKFDDDPSTGSGSSRGKSRDELIPAGLSPSTGLGTVSPSLDSARDPEPVEGSNRAEGASGVEFTDLNTLP